MMLSSLPPELLLQIIESTVPHTFHTRTYDDRQRSLSSLSLVSKQFYPIAQPLLYEIVWIKSLETLKRYQTTINSFGEGERGGTVWKPKSAVIGSKVYSGPAKMTQEAISKEAPHLFSSVKSLTWNFDYCGFERFPQLNGLSDLSSLHLSRVHVDAVNAPKLPKLRSLTLYGVEGPLIASLLDPAVVPSLKHFAFDNITAGNAHHLKQSRIADLLPHLETIYLSAALWLHPELSFLRSAANRTLISSFAHNVDRITPLEARVVHLRIMHIHIHSGMDKDTPQQLDQLASSFNSALPLSFQSLYLDSSLKPTSSLPAKTSKSVRKLVDICNKREIEVIFEMIPDDLCRDSWISEEFMRRQWEQKKKEVADSTRGLDPK
ncbi:hypothetical protein JCM3765_005450 [Sporobolomyces pararoseus]